MVPQLAGSDAYVYIKMYIFCIGSSVWAWAYYAFQITYYAFEQCSKIFLLCPIMLHCGPLCSP